MQTVLSGHKRAVEAVCANMKADSKTLAIRHAMHSPLVSPILPELRKVIESCKLQPSSTSHIVSSLTGTEVSTEFSTVDHWLGHDQVKPMLFLQGMEALANMGCTAFLEIGPQPVLVKMGRRCLPASPQFEWLTSLQPGRDEAESMLLVTRVLGMATSQPSELKPVPLPWRAPLLHPLLGQRQDQGVSMSFNLDRSKSTPWPWTCSSTIACLERLCCQVQAIFSLLQQLRLP